MNYDFSIHQPAVKGTADRKAGAVQESDVSGRVQREVLYGTDMRYSEIPLQTLSSSDRRIVFPDSQGRAFAMTEGALSKHLLLLGSIGCGKTNVFNFIIESLSRKMGSDDVMIIFDTKGDFREKFYNPQIPGHWLIGNEPCYENLSRSWNIFDELRNADGSFDKESELTAKEIAKQLFKGRESSTQPFFALAAADLTAKVMIHLMRKAKKQHTERSLGTADFVHFLQRANIETYYNMTADPDNPDFVSAQLYFGKPGEKMTAQALGIFGYINAMINDLFVGIFAERRWSGEFSMKRIVHEKGKRIIFIEYDLSMGETLSPMYRLMFDLALKEALGGRQSRRGNTYLIIDEFKLLPDLQHIDDALNFGRSLGVKVCAGLQSISQLYDIYGPDRGKVLMSGFMNVFCFHCVDPESRQYIKERFGEKYENLAFRPLTEPISVQREGHVVEDWDVQSLAVGESYIYLNGHLPFRFRFSEFDKPHQVL